MGFKTDSSSTGPLDNSAFILKVNDSMPQLFLTAHHVVAGIGNDRYLKWDKLESNQKNAWAWSMHDSTFNFKISKNLPIQGAETLKLDLAAFFISLQDIPYLKPAKTIAHIGDTIYLFSKINYQNKTTLLNPGVVIYREDSVLIYELTEFDMARVMNGTSGSAVLNKDGEVVSNSYGGFTIPNDQIKKEIATQFPLLKKVKTKNGKTYGVGIPIRLIEKSLIQAFAENRQQNQSQFNGE